VGLSHPESGGADLGVADRGESLHARGLRGLRIYLVGTDVSKVRVHVCKVGMEGVGHDADSPSSLVACTVTSARGHQA
jgi:hypothetical protein